MNHTPVWWLHRTGAQRRRRNRKRGSSPRGWPLTRGPTPGGRWTFTLDGQTREHPSAGLSCAHVESRAAEYSSSLSHIKKDLEPSQLSLPHGSVIALDTQRSPTRVLGKLLWFPAVVPCLIWTTPFLTLCIMQAFHYHLGFMMTCIPQKWIEEESHWRWKYVIDYKMFPLIDGILRWGAHITLQIRVFTRLLLLFRFPLD